ncbi:MAG: tetratricopeptide repeat protein [Candidatus Azotimanducaceae bacterium]
MNPTSEVEASIWEDLWKTRDQQAMEALEQGDAARASQLFENQSWRGIANYRNEAFTSAAEDFETIETSWAKYNLGNALAKSGNFEQAISAYEESLTINPDNADALHNKKIIEQLIENQSKPQKNNSGSEQKESEQSQQDRNKDTSNGAEEANTQKDNEKISPEAKSNQGEDGQTIDEEKISDEGDNSKQPRPEETEKGGDTQSTALAREEEQALEQWLRRVPDDPGGLLRNKFKLQFDERIRKGEESGQDVTNDW